MWIFKGNEWMFGAFIEKRGLQKHWQGSETSTRNPLELGSRVNSVAHRKCAFHVLLNARL